MLKLDDEALTEALGLIHSARQELERVTGISDVMRTLQGTGRETVIMAPYVPALCEAMDADLEINVRPRP